MFKKFLQLFQKRETYTLDDPTGRFASFFGIDDQHITPLASTRLATVHTCLKIRADAFAQLPLKIYRYSPDGSRREIAQTTLQTRPSRYYSAFQFWWSMRYLADAFGNSYAYLFRDSMGEVTEMVLLDPMKMYVSETVDTNGLPMYQWTYSGVPVLYDDLLHFKTNAELGVLGKSSIRYAADAIGLHNKQSKYGLRSLANQPPALLTTDQDIKQERAEQVRNRFQDMLNSGTIPVLQKGLTYQNIAIPPQDVQLLDAMKLTSRQIYGIFKVPPTMAGDYEHTAYSNSEQQDLMMVKHMLMPILREAEQEIHAKALLERPRLQPRFSVEKLLMADAKSRADYARAMINAGIITPNEARAINDLPPHEDGDVLLANAALMPVKDIKEGRNNENSNPDSNINVDSNEEE